MRVGAGAGARVAAEPRAARRFADALGLAARAAGAERAREGPRGSAAAAPARRHALPTRDRAELRERAVDDSAGSVARALGPPAHGAPAAEPAATPELRALARALPVAVETFGVRDGAPLALSFGGSLDVELRVAPGGVELVLRPDPRLARACAAGIAGLVAGLRRRGVAVVRAEVRGRVRGTGRGHGAGPGAPFVDLPVPLR